MHAARCILVIQFAQRHRIIGGTLTYGLHDDLNEFVDRNLDVFMFTRHGTASGITLIQPFLEVENNFTVNIGFEIHRFLNQRAEIEQELLRVKI